MFKDVPKTINGDTIVGFMNSKKIKELGWADMSSLASWYQDDPNKNHLGMIQLFSNMADYRMPTYENFFKTGAVIEVNGMDGKFTYDLPVTKPSGVFTTEDTSTFSDYPGIEGAVFPIVLDQPYTKGDVLTYDAMYGEQVIVSEDYEVEQIGDSWKHWVTYVTQNPAAYYPKEKLKAGVQYFKVAHALSEYSEQFSNIENPNPVGTVKCEFELGNHRGVETFYTMYADKKRFSGAAIKSQDFIKDYVQEQEKWGKDAQGRPLDTFMVGNIGPNGKVRAETVRIGATLEYLVLLELMKLETYQLLFQKGATITDINGTKRLNEGLWHQKRRGYRIEYSVPNGITRTHIKDAVSYLFQGNKTILPHERRIHFKAGYQAYLNILNLFREEVMMQLDGISQLIGHSTVLPKSPVSGPNLTSLSMEPIMFKQVNIPEIGIISVEHDPALDYLPLTDRQSAGFIADGYAWTSYSLVIEDAASPEYSNAVTSLPANAKVVDGGNLGANEYYIKPAGGENLWWGYSEGRYSPDKASGIVSSMKRLSREFWAHSVSASWVKDPSRYVFIELKR